MKKWLLVVLSVLGVALVGWATESSVISVGGGAGGATPGDVVTVTHSGSTPSAVTVTVPTTINGALTVTNGATVSAGNISATAGDLKVGTVAKGLVIKEGTVGAQGRSGTIAFQTGVLTVISNTSVTALTRCFLTKTTTTAPVSNTMVCTNMIGVGIQMIPAVVETNTYNFFLIEGQ